MSQAQVSSAARTRPEKARSPGIGRWYYTGAAVLMVVLAFWGFYRFYLYGQSYPGREIAPPIKILVILHGISMTGWLVMMCVQPALVRLGKRRLHMKLGPIAVSFAALIVVLGLWLAARSAAVTPPEAVIWGLNPRQFMAVPFFAILAFGTFVAMGVVYRRKPAVHRSMMLLGTLSALGAAVSRIDPLNSLYIGTIVERLLGPFAVTLAFGVLLIPLRWWLARTCERSYAIGIVLLIAASFLTMQIATTSGWTGVTDALIGSAASP